jgi:hypothetical protein
VERAFLPAMTAFLRASFRNAGTNAGMAASKGSMSFSFPIVEHLHKLWGGPPGSRPTPPSACSGWMRLIPVAKSGSGGTRADQGVRPTIYAGFPVSGILNGIEQLKTPTCF